MKLFRHGEFLRFFCWVVLGVAVFAWGGQAQTEKFGKVSKAELEMTSIPEAPDAGAVYLFDIGDMKITSDFVLSLERKVRIKILTEEGKESANIRIPYWHEDKIRGIKAHTILPNGKKIKLNKKESFEEKVKNTRFKVFTFPGVEVGSVIEYKYQLTSEYLHYLEPWYFQHEEYTLLSRISVMLPPEFSYTVFFRNVLGVEPTVQDVLRPGRVLKRYSWELRNLPPVKEEPYMRTKRDYLAALHFQLVTYRDPYNYIKFIQDWPDLVAKEWEILKKPLQDKSQKKLVERLTATAATDKEKVQMLYAFVRDSIETTGKGSRWVDKTPKEIMKIKKAKGAEKNMFLVNLLRLAGFDAYPLLISTWHNGLVLVDQPRLTQFNYLLAYVKIGLKEYVFDTRDKFCPADLLPRTDLVDRGLLINEEKGKFVKIPHPRKINMQYCATEAALSEDGSLSATATLRLEGMKAMIFRNRIAKSDSISVFEEFLKNRFPNVEIDSIAVQNFKDMQTPLVVSIRYHVPEFAQVVGDMIYLNAPAMDSYQSNPFKSEHRSFPVEFTSNDAATDKIDITVPEGYHISELPRNYVLKLKGITFLNGWKDQGNKIHFERQFMRRKLVFKPSEYVAMRSFFDQMVNADQGQMVLKQGDDEASPRVQGN